MAAEKITITVTGKKTTKEISVVKGTFLLNALIENDIHVPTLCHHKDLTPNGTCRLCVCEIAVKGRKKIVTACNYPIREKISVEAYSEKVNKHRKILAEMYLGRWPNVEAVQRVAKLCGVTDGSRFRSELTDENPKACILCGHCVKACAEFIQERIIDFAGRGIKRHLTMPFGETDPHCVTCTSCAYVCPTGAIQVIDDINNPVRRILLSLWISTTFSRCIIINSLNTRIPGRLTRRC
jgi:bidirectional [NiFe] hydrogenase diaphorase subunit